MFAGALVSKITIQRTVHVSLLNLYVNRKEIVIFCQAEILINKLDKIIPETKNRRRIAKGLNHFFLIDAIHAIGHLQQIQRRCRGKIFTSTRIRTHDLQSCISLCFLILPLTITLLQTTLMTTSLQTPSVYIHSVTTTTTFKKSFQRQ